MLNETTWILQSAKKVVSRNFGKVDLVIGLLLLVAMGVCAQKHSPTSAHTSYTGLAMTGYQGWFGTPNDGVTNTWRHYNGSNGFKPGSASIEYWPDMRETEPDERHNTDFTFDDGLSATVFSSVNSKTVNRHFQWMKEYGIDGAFVQRFKSDFGIRDVLSKVMLNAVEAAENNGRAVAVMYDIGANIYANGTDTASVNALRTFHVNDVFNDWKEMVDDLALTTRGADQAYLYHDGKPMVAIWGVGFNHRHNSTGLDMEFWFELVEKFKNDPDYGGCSILLGVPTHWRQGGSDCISGNEHTRLLELIRDVEAIMPWHTSRFRRNNMATTYSSLVVSDNIWCQNAGVAYAPNVSPGIREKILHGNGFEIFREGGYYFWDMARVAIKSGSELLYFGMFDEIDEGTQLYKINNNPPFYSDAISFTSYGDNPEDHYLWLAGEVTRALRGEFEMGPAFRQRADDSDFKSVVSIVETDSTYGIQLATPAMGRKVFYANPYSVPDGAPTIGTLRDTSLFSHELTKDLASFNEDQRGKYLRMIEVDSTTGGVISFKALVAVNGYSLIPYSSNFETAKVDAKYWTTNSDSDSGRVWVTDAHDPRAGSYHLAFDTKSALHTSTNAADLHLDLGEVTTDILLDVSYRLFGSDTDAQNGIYFSEDGGSTFEKVYQFHGVPGTYHDTSLNINQLAAGFGLDLTHKFVIRVQHTATAPIPEGGMALDDVRVYFSQIPSGYAKYLRTDNETQGAWQGNYGVNGYFIAERDTSLPAGANIVWSPGTKSVVWEQSSSDIRGLQFSLDSTILSARYGDSMDDPWWFTLDIGEQEAEVSLYFLDGDFQGRSFVLEVVDNATGDRYDVQTIQDVVDGKWYTWRVRGAVRFVATTHQGSGPVVSGVFFDPLSSSDIEVTSFLTFDGQDDFVDCGRGEALQISGTEITLEAWFKVNGADQIIWQGTILAMDHSEAGNDVGYFLRANGEGQIEWGFGDGTWHQISSQEGVRLFELETWNHVAGVYDGSVQKIFLNGNVVASEEVDAMILPTSDEPLFIGSSPFFPDRVIDASLSEIRIWNMARSDEDIRIFSSQRISGNEPGLVAYWPIDEGQGQNINDLGPNAYTGLLGGTTDESSRDPIWTQASALIDILEDFNGSFEDGLTYWRFYEVPNSLGSVAEIIQGDVIDGANAMKITYENPDDQLVDRSLDNWDSNMPLQPGAEYFAKFWSKASTPDSGQLRVAHGFFDADRQVISENALWFELTDQYQLFEFDFVPPENTAFGWLAFRWKDRDSDEFRPGEIFIDQIQLFTEDPTVAVQDLANGPIARVVLEPNYPNPFSSFTTIAYRVNVPSEIELSIYNLSGSKVAQLVDQRTEVGRYEVDWNPRNLPRGIYIAALRANSELLTKKLMLLD